MGTTHIAGRTVFILYKQFAIRSKFLGMDRKEVWELILKELSDDITPEESGDLKTWISASESNALWYERMRDPENINQFLSAMKDGDSIVEKSWRQIQARQMQNEAKIIRPWFLQAKYMGLVVAASLVLLISGPVFYRLKPNDQSALTRDIAPGGNHATLTLGNGKVVVLDSAKDGLIAEQGTTKIVKEDAGNITYQGQLKEETIAWNTISVPRGGQYRVILPDGSKVVLNSSSSLRFPTAFQGHNRQVILKGEGYFDVVHNPDAPFVVKLEEMPAMQINALGTAFNIMAYVEEGPVKTTLLNGSVKVDNGDHSVLMLPDQVATAGSNGSLQLAAPDTSTRSNAAWAINGLFYFNHADIKSIMRQIARWYSVDVEYGSGPIPKGTYSGLVGRDKSLSVVMNILKFYGLDLKYQIDGRKIIVQP